MKTFLTVVTLACAVYAADYTVNIADSYQYQVSKLVIDASGNTVAAGSRVIPGSTPGIYLSDIFVTKLDSAGKILFTSTFSGKGTDQVNDAVVDSAGNIYVAGSTSSGNFPLRNALQSEPSNGSTGFLMKISSDGSQLIFSTRFGGTKSMSSVSSIALDSGGNIYLAGQTWASDFPVSSGLRFGPAPSFGVAAHGAAFVAKLPPTADKITFAATIAGDSVACGAGSSCFLSARSTSAAAVAVDAAGNVVIGGNSNITDLATTTNALAPKGIGAFVASIDAAGRSMRYLTYLGTRNAVLAPWANPGTVLHGLTLDPAGNALIAGETNDEKIGATAGTVQPAYSGPAVPQGPESPQRDGFIAKLSADGTRFVWATFLGGKSPDAAQRVALDRSGNVWVAGTTLSAEFPNANGWGSGADFISALKSDGSALIYSARFPDNSAAQSIAVDGSGVLHAAGLNGLISTITPGQPIAPRLFGITNAAGSQVSGRIAPGEIISLYGPVIGPETPLGTTLDSSGRVSTTLGGTRVSIGGMPAPLLYASRTQINAVVPLGTTAGTRATVSIVNGGTVLPDFSANVGRDDPQIFKNADGSAAAINDDGTVNSRANPARPRSVITIWATGVDNVRGGDGTVAQAADNYYCCSAMADNSDAQVLYAGASPGFVAGAVQVNLLLPGNLFGSASQLTLRSVSTGRTSASVPVYVTP
jgi:uncharacterized protein (TIGR03437 family)